MPAISLPERDTLVEEIVEREWDMMKAVVSDGRSLCQERPGTFRAMREMSHSVLSRDTLASYLGDLRNAFAEGRNLVTEKYARMEEKISPVSECPLIPRIVAIELEWMRELCADFPATFQASMAYFARYEACELETYSDSTLTLLYRDVLAARESGRNLVRERYENLFRRLGKGTIAEVEAGGRERAALEAGGAS
ncbi:MAG: DUF4125 family protein [Holophagales bacterium]|nr:DUF4125 family protein [Holophagales bacterium]